MLYYDKETTLTFAIADDHKNADVENVGRICKRLFATVARIIEDKTGKSALITNGKRSVQEQITAMDNLRRKVGDKEYKRIYGRIIQAGIRPENMPHVAGRAIDCRLTGYEDAVPSLHEFNALYLEDILHVIGYVPARPVVIENGNCIHIQSPPAVHDVKAYQDYVERCASMV